MAGIFRGLRLEVFPCRRCIQVARIKAFQALVRSLVIVYLHEGIKALLLLQEVEGGGLGGLLFQGQVHAFITSVLLGMAGYDAFDADGQT